MGEREGDRNGGGDRRERDRFGRKGIREEGRRGLRGEGRALCLEDDEDAFTVLEVAKWSEHAAVDIMPCGRHARTVVGEH